MTHKTMEGCGLETGWFWRLVRRLSSYQHWYSFEVFWVAIGILLTRNSRNGQGGQRSTNVKLPQFSMRVSMI